MITYFQKCNGILKKYCFVPFQVCMCFECLNVCVCVFACVRLAHLSKHLICVPKLKWCQLTLHHFIVFQILAASRYEHRQRISFRRHQRPPEPINDTNLSATFAKRNKLLTNYFHRMATRSTIKVCEALTLTRTPTRCYQCVFVSFLLLLLVTSTNTTSSSVKRTKEE